MLVLRIMGAKASLTTAHHPQSDSQSERMIQSLLCLIRTYTEENPSDWEDALPLLQYAINDAYCNSTRTIPFKVIYGDSLDPAYVMAEDNRRKNYLTETVCREQRLS